MRVLTQEDSSGNKHSCDSRCHNSTKRSCDCICHGLLHGKGTRHAMLNAAMACYYVNKSYSGNGSVYLHAKLIPDIGGR